MKVGDRVRISKPQNDQQSDRWFWNSAVMDEFDGMETVIIGSALEPFFHSLAIDYAQWAFHEESLTLMEEPKVLETSW